MNSSPKKALVTGATRGIGSSIGLILRRSGLQVIGTATTKEGVNNLKEKGIIGIQLDLNSENSVENFLSNIGSDHQNISILVNNAGITKDNLVIRMSDNEWMEVINIHLNCMFKITKKILKPMIKNKWGRIINITSAAASIGNKGQSNYAAAKSGVEAFSRTLANEVGTRGITVNSIAPGYIDTDMIAFLNDQERETIKKRIPLLRFGKPEEIAELVSFLISEEAEYITGQTIHINGGLFMQ